MARSLHRHPADFYFDLAHAYPLRYLITPSAPTGSERSSASPAEARASDA